MIIYKCSVCGRKVKTKDNLSLNDNEGLRCMWVPNTVGSCHGEMIPLISEKVHLKALEH